MNIKLAVIIADLYKLHLHPTVKKYFPIVDKYDITMILQPVKNKSEGLSNKSEVVNDLAI
jgi:hypothetical protein